MELTFITGNAEKSRYISNYLGLPIKHQKIDLPEIQGLDLEEITTIKAQAAYKIVEGPVLVEDVALVFTALGSLPGPLIKWFLESLGNAGLAHLAHKYTDHTATARVVYCLYDGATTYLFSGETAGTIAETPRGSEKFGWDPIFIPLGHTKTWAEMTDDEKHETAMRKPALDQLRQFIVTQKPER